MDEMDDVKNKNYINVKLFGILPIIRINFFKKIYDYFKGKDIYSVAKIVNEKIEKKRQKKRIKKRSRFHILNGVKVDSLYLCFGFNLGDYIINSYVNAALNNILCLGFNMNQKIFNIYNIYYRIYISQEPINIVLNTEIKISLLKMI